MLKYVLWVFSVAFAFAFSSSASGYALSLEFRGHLSHEKVQEIKAQLDTLSKENSKEIVFTIQSQSGELLDVLDLAKLLFEIRENTKMKFIVFINDEAIGPAAILPFLADDLYSTRTVSWGAITSHPENNMPTNLLRSRIEGLIRPNHPKFQLMKLLADAMCDPGVVVVESDGWKEKTDEKEIPVGSKGETLVVNQNELQKLGLLSGIMTYEEFTAKFLPEIKTEHKTSAKEEEKKLPLNVLSNASSESFNQKLAQYVHFQSGEPNTIGRIVIDDRQSGINQSTWIYVNSALSQYKKTKPACIILELNTPGGEVFAAQLISDALKDMDTQYGIPVIAYINNWAISAGAMLAYSCRFIVTAKDGAMGAAEPVYMGEAGKMETASEKVNSALRTDFANRAKFFERNSDIAEAMVDKDIILVMRHGEIIKLEADDQIRKGGIDPDIVISPKGKLLTLTAEQLITYKVADMLLHPVKLEPLTDEEIKLGSWPLAKSPLSLIETFHKAEPCQIETYHMNWQTKFLAFLTSPAISSLLFLGMIICFYIEMSSPGVALPGIVGLLCLFFIILSSFAMEAIHWLEPILLLFGLFLLALEIFFFPTLGILALLGSIFVLVGLGGMMLPGIGSVHIEGTSLNAAGEYVLSRLGWLSATLLLAFLFIMLLSRFVRPHFRLMQKFVLHDTTLLATGKHEMQARSPSPEAVLKLGDEAIVSVTLRPAGKIIVGGIEVDVISTGNFIEKGKRVRVLHIEGEKIIVEEVYT